MDVKVGEGGLVGIPAGVRRELGIEEGDVLRLEVDVEGRLILERLPRDPLERLREVGARYYGGCRSRRAPARSARRVDGVSPAIPPRFRTVPRVEADLDGDVFQGDTDLVMQLFV